MTTVYVVCGGHDYEGEDVRGVFATLKEAKAFVFSHWRESSAYPRVRDGVRFNGFWDCADVLAVYAWTVGEGVVGGDDRRPVYKADPRDVPGVWFEPATCA